MAFNSVHLKAQIRVWPGRDSEASSLSSNVQGAQQTLICTEVDSQRVDPRSRKEAAIGGPSDLRLRMCSMGLWDPDSGYKHKGMASQEQCMEGS